MRASDALSDLGTTLGFSDAPGEPRLIALEREGRFRHLAVTGPTGTGKTTLLARIVLSDLRTDRAVLVVDPKGDLVDAVLARMPTDRRDDVVVLDPSDADRPVGFNVLRTIGDRELAAEVLLSTMHRLWSANWGIRSEDVLRAALRTLILLPDPSLADVGPILTDPRFRARLVPRLADPTLIGFWRSFEQLSAAEQAQWTGPVLNKWRSLMARPSLRRVLGQPNPAFDLARALNGRGVVLVPLNAGLLGGDAANLFGSLILGAAWNVVQARAGSKDYRQSLMWVVDEIGQLSALPMPFESVLSQARSYRVGVTVACQHLTQLPPDLRQAVMANPRSRVAFQSGHDDAQALARQFMVDPQDVQSLAAHQVLAQLWAKDVTQPTATLRTLSLPEPTTSAKEVRRRSAERWGADGAAVDAALTERLMGREVQASGPRKPPGRKPRAAQ